MHHLRGHADLLVRGHHAALDAAHRLRGGAGVGLKDGQGAAVVLPVRVDLLEDQRLLVSPSLEGVHPQGAKRGEKQSNQFLELCS